MNYGHKLACVSALVLVSVAAVAGPKLPDDVLGVLEVRGLDKAIGEISAIAKPLGIPLEREALAAMLSGKLSTTGMAGIDRTRSVKIVILAAQQQSGGGPAMPGKPEGTIVLPLTDDGQTYIKMLQAAYDTAAKVEGVSRFQNPVGQGAMFHDMHAVVVNKHIVLSDKRQSVERVAAHLKKGAIKNNIKIPVSGTIRAVANVKAIVAMAEVFTTMMSPGGPGAAKQNAPDPMAQAKTMLRAMRQVETVSVGLKGSKDDITLVVRVDPVADTLLAKTFAKLTAPSGTYASLLPAGSPFVSAGSGLNIWDDVLDSYMTWMDDLYAQIGAMTGDKGMETMWQSLRGNITATRGMYSGDFAYGLLTASDGSALGLVQVTAVTDPDAVSKIMEKSLLAMNEIPNLPVKVIVKEPRNYKGVKVRKYKYDINLGDVAAGMPPPVAGLLDKMQFEVAMVDKSAVTSFGSPKAMNKIIDRLKNKGASSAGIGSRQLRTLFPMLAYKPVAFWTLDVLATLKAGMGMVPNADLSLIQQIPDGKGKLGGYCRQKDGALETVTKVAMSEILAIKSAIGPIQEVGTKLMAGMMGGAGATPTEPSALCGKNLRLIAAAKQVYALEEGVDDAAVPPVEKLLQYFPGRKVPVCPAGGKYTINAINAKPACSSAGHALK